MTPTPDEMARWRELCEAAARAWEQIDAACSGLLASQCKSHRPYMGCPMDCDDVADALDPELLNARPVIVDALNALPRLLDECERLRGREAISDEAVDRYLRELASVAADRDRLRAGHCLSVIPETFIACGEGGNYCSEACRLRALLSTAARKLDFLLRDYPGDKETAELIAAIKREGLT